MESFIEAYPVRRYSSLPSFLRTQESRAQLTPTLRAALQAFNSYRDSA